MGSPEDEWGHGVTNEVQTAVTLTRRFLMKQHEVTQVEWTAMGLPNPSGLRPDGLAGDGSDPSCPVGNVTWFEAIAYANLPSERHDPPLQPCYEMTSCQGEVGQGMYCLAAHETAATLYDCEGYRLPTDAEWEYATRAGTRTAFYTGDITVYDSLLHCGPDANLEPIAWYCYNSAARTHPVGQLAPNGWGLYDVLGNAYEWVNDHYRGLPPSSDTDPGGVLQQASGRIVRGGDIVAWSTLCRQADQSIGGWDHRAPGYGFRLARTLPP
jgi:formylglycine-generating enzyme required for sulfatase activity